MLSWNVLLCLGVVISATHIVLCSSASCPAQKFLCDGVQCIPTRWRCDGAPDCRDYSDEMNCDKDTCGPKYSRCDDGQCVPESWWCDGQSDCVDSSDEAGCDQSATTTTTHKPQKEPSQIKPKGEEVAVLFSTDYNMYHTTVSNDPAFPSNTTKLGMSGRAVGEIVAFDVDIRRRRVCWTDQKWKTLMCGKMADSMDVTSYQVLDSTSTGAQSPRGVALDWTNNNVYWTDNVRGTVSVSSLEGNGRGKKTIIEGLNKPEDITLDPRNGLLFVSEPRTRVVRYKLDGSDPRVVVEGGVQYITGMTIDFTTNRLFWLDGRNRSLSSCDLHGGSRKTLSSHNKWWWLEGLAVWRDTTGNKTSVFWAQPHGIVRSDDLTSDNVTVLFERSQINDIKVFLESSQPKSVNHCHNTPCSHLCIPNGEGSSYTCACPDNYQLDSNRQTCRYQGISKQHSACRPSSFQCKNREEICIPIRSVCDGSADCPDSSDEGSLCGGTTPYLLTTETGSVQITSLADDNFNSSSMSGQIESIQNAHAVDVDVRRRQVFFVVKNSILRADITDSVKVQGVTTVIYRESSDILDLSVDWIHGLLYWVDGYHKTVCVSTQDGSFTQVLRGGDPTGIAVDPIRGWMYIADNQGRFSKARILKIGMNGKTMSDRRRSELMPDLGKIGSVAIDFQSEDVYWTDHIIKALMSLPLSGRGGLLVKSDPQQGTMSGLSVHQGSVYVSDIHKNTLRRFSRSGDVWEDVRMNAESPSDTAVLDISSQPMATTHCTKFNGGCSHVCIPTPSGRVCQCPSSLALTGTQCEYEEMLLINDGETVTRVDLRSEDGDFFSAKELKFPAEGVGFNSSAVFVDVDVRNNAIFWTDSNMGAVYMTRFKANLEFDVCEKIFSENIVTPQGLAVDWVNQNLYWSDYSLHSISMGSLRTRAQKTLIDTGLEVVRGMAVEPRTRWLYWTNWGKQQYSKVERCGLDGNHRQDVISTGLITPNGLAIDYEDDRLFVGDAGIDVIMSCSLTGSNCYKLHTSLKQEEISSITLHLNYVYWADITGRNIWRMTKDTGQNKNTVREFVITKPHGTVVFHPDRQPSVPSACDRDNRGCLLCLPNSENGGFQCSCPDGRHLSRDGKSCSVSRGCSPGYKSQQGVCVPIDVCHDEHICSQICRNTAGSYQCLCHPGYSLVNQTRCRLQEPLPSLLLVDGRSLRILDRFNSPKARVTKVAPPRSLRRKRAMKRPIGVDVDVAGRRIFWTDKRLKAVKMATFRNNTISSVSVLVNSGVRSPESMAFDWIHNSVYWVGSRPGVIRVVSVPTKVKRTVYGGLVRPRATAIDPDQGFIYWTSWSRNPSIERGGMDGSQRKILISTNIFWPNGLTIDYSERRLYWTDGGLGVISSCDMNGQNRKVVYFSHSEHPQHMFSVAVIEDYVYWTDWKKRHVMRIQKSGHELRVFTEVGLRMPTDAKVIHPSRQPKGTHHCGKNNGGCSHICAPTPSNGRTTFTCQCPDDMRLSDDGVSCIE